MTPTRRKPVKRKIWEKSIGTADALPVDEPCAYAAESYDDGMGVAADGMGAIDAEEDAAVRGEKRRRGLGPFHLALLAVLAVLVVVEGGFCLMRWGLDDAADMQGTWYVNESQATMVITAESIVLADDVAYSYALDEGAKTIGYSFGIMEGSGRYRFSLDRDTLAIMDGEYTFMETLTADISWTFEALLAQLSGASLSPGAGEHVTLLKRAQAALPPAVEGDAEGGLSEGGAEGGAYEGDLPGDTPVGNTPMDEEPSGQPAEDMAGDSSDAGATLEAPGYEGSAPSQGQGAGDWRGGFVLNDKPQDA